MPVIFVRSFLVFKLNMYVYKTTNILNGLIYIGISKRESKSSEFYLGSGKLLKQAISEFGRGCFKKEIIVEDSNFFYSDLQRLEIFLIDIFDARNREIGYNLSEGGDGNCAENNGMFNKKHTEQTKDKISRTRKKRREDNPEFGQRSEEALKRLSKTLSERNKQQPTLPNGHTEDTKSKISKTLKEKASKGELHTNHAKFTEERKQEYSERFSGELNPFYGKKHSEETKQKMRENISKRFPSVDKLNFEGVIIHTYNSITDVSQDGYRPDLVKKVLKGENKSHGGFFWKIH